MGKSGGGSSGSDFAAMLAQQQYQDAKPIQDLVYKDLTNFMQGGGETTTSWTESSPGGGGAVFGGGQPTTGYNFGQSNSGDSGKNTYRGASASTPQTIVRHTTTTPGGGYDGYLSRNPVYMGGKQRVEGEYQTGMENILSNLPAGGAMYETMAGMEQNRAQSLGDLASNVYQDLYNKAYGVATGSPQQSISQLAQTGAASDAADAQRDAGNAQAAGGAASAIGSIIAAMLIA